LLQFPPNVRLDNSILSQDQTVVKKQKQGVSYDETETGIAGVVSNAMMVYWEIAEDAPGVCVGNDDDDDDDDAAAFA
jgi:hypothetical protein